MASDADILKDALEVFAEAEEKEKDNRDAAENDLEFRLGNHWTDDEIESRTLLGLPMLTVNKFPAIIRQVVNDARQNTPAITVRPVDDGADIETAEIYSGLIRDIEAQSSADIAYETAIDFAASCGFGYFRINTAYVDDNAFDQDIRIDGVRNPFSIFGDPYSDAPDSSDWNVAFVMDSLKRSAFEKRFSGKDLVPWTDSAWNDKKEPWKDGDSITYAEYWVRSEIKKQITALNNGMIVSVDEYKKDKAFLDTQGIMPIGQTRDVVSHKVTQYLLTACDVLETTEWAGRYIPIVPVYGEDINVKGKRHLRSLIRDAKDPARMHNYFRTVSAQMVALAPKAPYIGKAGSFSKDPRWETADKISHPYLEYSGDIAPQRQPFAGVPSGVISEALAASDDIKATTGMYDASLGQRSNETSGRAILARQREGDVGTFHFQDNLSRAIRHGGRILLDLIPKVYSTARVVRTLGPDKKSKVVKIGPREEGAPQPPPGAERIYDLSVGRYDLAVDAGPSFTTRREEAASQMMELIRVMPAAAPLIGDLLAQSLDWPGAQDIAKRLKTMLPPQLQQPEEGAQPQPGQPGPQGGAPAIPPQAIELLKQGKQMIDQLRGELTKANGELDQVKADNWAERMKVMIDAYEAQTDRMKILPGQVVPGPLPQMPPAAAPMPAPEPMQPQEPQEPFAQA